MPPDSVWIRDQSHIIPNDNGLYIVVGQTDLKPQSVGSYLINNTDGSVTEEQRVQAYEKQQIDIFSRDVTALKRRVEILMALQSFYSQQQQEIYSFRIFQIPQNFINTSDTEGGSRINRFSITIVCATWYKKDKLMTQAGGDYYDDFSTRVDDEETIGTDTPLIEFEITGD